MQDRDQLAVRLAGILLIALAESLCRNNIW
jgi:hypothetical protein